MYSLAIAMMAFASLVAGRPITDTTPPYKNITANPNTPAFEYQHLMVKRWDEYSNPKVPDLEMFLREGIVEAYDPHSASEKKPKSEHYDWELPKSNSTPTPISTTHQAPTKRWCSTLPLLTPGQEEHGYCQICDPKYGSTPYCACPDGTPICDLQTCVEGPFGPHDEVQKGCELLLDDKGYIMVQKDGEETASENKPKPYGAAGTGATKGQTPPDGSDDSKVHIIGHPDAGGNGDDE